MITRDDILDALTMLTGNAPDKTPQPSELVTQAWLDYFKAYPSWIGDELVAAASDYCRSGTRERMVQPADLGEIIRGWRQDTLARMSPEERESAWEQLGGGGYPGDEQQQQRTPRDRYGVPDKSQLDEPPCPIDWTSDQRLKAYWERVRSGVVRPGRIKDEPSTVAAGYGNAPDEHEPGVECKDPSCEKPSTFGDYCAQHYVLSFQVVKGML